MKAKHAVILAAVVLGVAQIVHSIGRARARAEAEALAARPPAAAVVDEVTAFSLSRAGGGAAARLVRVDGTWLVESLHSAPADAGKVERFLDTLLLSERRELDSDAERSHTGLRDGDGIAVALWGEDGRELPGVVVGLRPEDDFNAVYARPARGGRVFLIAGDVRGDMGLWQNLPDTPPESRFWLETRALSFDPARATAVRCRYPDHGLEFIRDAEGNWTFVGDAPGGLWSPEGLAAWLADLSRFQILDAAAVRRAAAGLDKPAYTLEIEMADGPAKRVAVAHNNMADGMWVETSDFPGRVYELPMWRFRLYFLRLDTLFPAAAPAFDPRDVRIVDIRRGGESVKISRREDGWRAVAFPYPPRQDRVDRLVRLASSWRPRDYAEPGGAVALPAYGGPLLEITLADGEIHQYRLGGRYPDLPWRYVMVDGAVLLSAAESDADALFPEFADILDMGRVFDDIPPDGCETIELVSADDKPILVIRRVHGLTPFWEAEAAEGEVRLSPEEVAALVAKPMTWAVAGIPDAAMGIPEKAHFRVRATGGGGDQTITILPPMGRDVSFLNSQGRALVIKRTDFFPWLGGLSALTKRIGREER